MNMIERASRALCAANGMEPNRPIGAGHDLRGQPQWRLFVDEARAVIEALREPDKEMIDAARTAQFGELSKQSARFIWQAMIDELLRD